MAVTIQTDITDGMYVKLDLGNSVPVPVKDYNVLINKPSINGIELSGNKTSFQLGIHETVPIANEEIEQIIVNVFG